MERIPRGLLALILVMVGLLLALVVRADLQGVLDPAQIMYTRDDRTGMCFAYERGEIPIFGRSLAYVPCEQVPEHLLQDQ